MVLVVSMSNPKVPSFCCYFEGANPPWVARTIAICRYESELRNYWRSIITRQFLFYDADRTAPTEQIPSSSWSPRYNFSSDTAIMVVSSGSSYMDNGWRSVGNGSWQQKVVTCCYESSKSWVQKKIIFKNFFYNVFVLGKQESDILSWIRNRYPS